MQLLQHHQGRSVLSFIAASISLFKLIIHIYHTL
jgi:hypothetical protein